MILSTPKCVGIISSFLEQSTVVILWSENKNVGGYMVSSWGNPSWFMSDAVYHDSIFIMQCYILSHRSCKCPGSC